MKVASTTVDGLTKTGTVDLYLDLPVKSLTQLLFEDNDEILRYPRYHGEPRSKQRHGRLAPILRLVDW
jgi:hypothetical protein